MLIKLQIYSYKFLLVNKIMKPTPGVEPSTSNLPGLMVSKLARQVKGPGVGSIILFTNQNLHGRHIHNIICLFIFVKCV